MKSVRNRTFPHIEYRKILIKAFQQNKVEQNLKEIQHQDFTNSSNLNVIQINSETFPQSFVRLDEN